MNYSVRVVCKFIICIMVCVEITYLALQFIAIDRGKPKRLPSRTYLNRPKDVTFLHGKQPSLLKQLSERNEPVVRKVTSNKQNLSTNGSFGDVHGSGAINITNLRYLSNMKEGYSKGKENEAEKRNVTWMSVIQTPEFNTQEINSRTKFVSCKEISRINITDMMGRGTTKEAFVGTLNGSAVCVKMVTSSVSDVRTCLKREHSSSSQCSMLANYKLMKEISLILQLHHQSIVKMLGFCIRSEANTKKVKDHGVVMVTELGLRVTPYRLKEMNWAARLQAAVDILNLLDFLHRSPLGSLRMPDFKQSQFIFVNGRIKLSDLDDITNDQRQCQRDRDCYILDESANVPCSNGFCSGSLNYKSNLLLATVELLQPLLAESPSFLNDVTSKFLHDLSYKRLNTGQAKSRIDKIVKLWLINNS